MTAAETGHLVLSTLHTNNAPQTIDRILDSFPEGQQRQIRIQLSQVLRAVISLQLVERSDHPGLIAAVEILRDNPRIQKLILEGNIAEIGEEIEKSVSFYKMQSMNQSLMALVLNAVVKKETALRVSINPSELDMELRKFLFAPAKPIHQDSEELSIADFMEMSGQGASALPHQGEDMAEPLSDFSKIVELQEVRKLYEESRSKHLAELQEKDEHIQRLDEDLRQKDLEISELKEQMQASLQEREKLKQQVSFTKNDLEAKIARLQERIQQLSAPTAAPAAKTPTGYFKKP